MAGFGWVGCLLGWCVLVFVCVFFLYVCVFVCVFFCLCVCFFCLIGLFWIDFTEAYLNRRGNATNLKNTLYYKQSHTHTTSPTTTIPLVGFQYN